MRLKPWPQWRLSTRSGDSVTDLAAERFRRTPHRAGGVRSRSAARPTGRTAGSATPAAERTGLAGVPDGYRTLFRDGRSGPAASCLNNAGTGLALGLLGPQFVPPRHSSRLSPPQSVRGANPESAAPVNRADGEARQLVPERSHQAPTLE